MRHEDCGPCTQLGVAMAERAGVPPDVLRALLEEDAEAMPADVALVWRFTRATLAHDPAADQHRRAIVERWGPRALVSLAFAMVAARSYPTVKYAMGHGQACTRVVVGGAPVALERCVARRGLSARRVLPETMTDPAGSFEPHRRRLLGLAYRMLGSMAEAEDAVPCGPSLGHMTMAVGYHRPFLPVRNQFDTRTTPRRIPTGRRRASR